MGERSFRVRVFLQAFLFLGLVIASNSSNWAHAQPGIFKLTLMVPQPNPARQAWSLVVQNNLQSLGIDAGRVVLDWNTIYSKALTPAPSILGKTYDQGGFDALFLGFALGIDPDPWSAYHSSQYAPTGSNYYLWNNTANDQLSTQIRETLDPTQRSDLIRQWQVQAYDQQPSATILYTQEIVAFDTSMSNPAKVFTTYHYPTWPPVEQLSMTNGLNTGSITIAQTGSAPSQGINPVLTSTYYDQTVWGPVFSSLAQRNDTIFKTMNPQLATGWSAAPDQKTWTVTLRQGVTWHDGAPFNATDVKFTFDALQDDTLAVDNEAFVKGIIGGKANVAVVDPYTVKFTLPVPYAYFVQNILTLPIIPAHILQTIPYTSWRSNPFNTGVGGGPIGTGPYKFVSYDSISETNHLIRNNNYFDFPQNGKSALIARGAFQVQDYYVRHIDASDAAITALKTGSVNVLDSQYGLQTQASFLTDWAGKWVSYDGYGVQELGFNMRHPIIGTGVSTPLGQRDPSKAAIAAKYVRQAISYAIPRDLIIQQLLNGYGISGITTPVIGDYRTGYAVMDGFNTALVPYSFNLTKSRQLLQAAGYYPPTSPSPSVWDTYGFAVTVMLLGAVATLAAVYATELRRKRPVEAAPAPNTVQSKAPHPHSGNRAELTIRSV